MDIMMRKRFCEIRPGGCESLRDIVSIGRALAPFRFVFLTVVFVLLPDVHAEARDTVRVG